MISTAMYRFSKKLSEMLPNLQELTVAFMHQLCLDECLRNLFKTFTQLKRLSLSDNVHIDGKFLRTLEALDQLSKLEELSLDNLRLPVTSLAPSETLRRLTFKDVDEVFSDGEALIVPQKFSQLRYFEVDGCSEFTTEGARMLRARMPNCVVHYVPTPALDFW